MTTSQTGSQAPILHIARRTAWEQARQEGAYHGDTLATEGFIHCSTPRQVLPVANARFRGAHGLVLLRIDPALLQPALRYEEGEPGEQYPHIYGPLNITAVVDVLTFEPDDNGEFALPEGIGS